MGKENYSSIDRLAEWTFRKLWRGRKRIAKAGAHSVCIGAGLARGFTKFGIDTASRFLYTKKEIKTLEEKIHRQSKEYNILKDRKEAIIDAGIINGVLLGKMLADDVPKEVELAYSAAYPNLAERLSFKDAVEGFNSSEITGFLSGVKGKLFEMKYADYLNNGNLPKGYYAELASSPTQPGYDLIIKGDGELTDVFQLKATDSVSYVRKAMEKYPDIDVVTTDEVHSQLIMHAADPDVINSGISNAEIGDAVNDAADINAFDFIDGKLPIIGLSLIAFSSYTYQDSGIYMRSFNFGNRSAKSILAYSAGGALIGLTGVWWIGIIGALGTRFIADGGEKNRKTYYKLKSIAKTNEKVIQRYASFA